jgi:hypothetical protein
MKERDHYPAFRDHLRLDPSVTSHAINVNGESLTSVDVLVGRGDQPVAAVEVKALAFPNGSAGYGAFGQALMLQLFVPCAYVGLFAGHGQNLGDCSWGHPSERQRQLAGRLDLDGVKAGSFDEYCKYLASLFRALAAGTGLGLLVLNYDDDEVQEVVPAIPGKPAAKPPASWVAKLRRSIQ